MMTMGTLRVLHVASFTGNIGDNANHIGFRGWFESLTDRAVIWTSLEIREFYWKERQWDDSFVELANAHDLLIIGGGNYFELWVETSPTGTSIAIRPETFAKLRTPIFFNALGVDPGQGVPDASQKKFTAFIDNLLSSSQYLVSVRNDGAHNNMRRYIGDARTDKVHRIPDGGFFIPSPRPATKPDGILRIGINIASDMPEFRFSGFSNSQGIIGFTKEMASAVHAIGMNHPDAEFVFLPHIFRDIDIISQVISHLPDRLRRTRLAIAPYGCGDDAARTSMSIYASCDLVLAMRFHANVCPIGMGVQTLGLSCYPQIENLYAELAQPERVISVGQPGFSELLASRASRALKAPETFPSGPNDARAIVEELRASFESVISGWLRKHSL